MELKSIWETKSESLASVLIVPLWNWNIHCQTKNQAADASSNCTFMELKSVMVNGKPDGERVLIVPLWNWNGAFSPVMGR